MKYIEIFLIQIYQVFFSFDHGIPAKILKRNRVCMFYPSCSEYSKQAIKKYGIFKGTYLGIKRILRCGPWSFDKPKWDPVK